MNCIPYWYCVFYKGFFVFFSNILISDEYKYCLIGSSETDLSSMFTQAGNIDEEK